MKNSLRSSFVALAMTSLFVGSAAQAGPESIDYANCNTSDVTLKTLFNMSAGTFTTKNLTSTACVGAFNKNDAPIPNQNLGYYQDGLFNGEAQVATGATLFPNGIFSDQYVAHNLGGSAHVDPGWILLASWNPQTGALKLPTIGGISGIQLDTWFNFTGTGSSGTWSFKPDAGVVSRASQVFGSNLFDQFAISFMSGSRFAAYDFVGSAMGLPTSASTIYGFSGEWNMSDTLFNGGGNAGDLSHIDLYVRDPSGGQTIPEPASLALLGLGLLGVSLIRRKSA